MILSQSQHQSVSEALHEPDPIASLISSPATPASLLFLKHVRFLLALGAFQWQHRLSMAIQMSCYLSWGRFPPALPRWTYPSSSLRSGSVVSISGRPPDCHLSKAHGGHDNILVLSSRTDFIMLFGFFCLPN